ncbi:unnamed protein product [Macrosiphum euphorbiae]|nr:unnamed protein product [Macrosiphum euphorbiae]
MLENVIGEDNNANLSENIVIENNNDNSDDFMNIASFLDLNNCSMSISGLEGYEYPIDQIQPLFDLLKKWDLECLSKTLIDEMVDMKILAIMKRDLAIKMLKTYPTGIKVLFTHHLENWQKSLDQQDVLCFSQTTNHNETTTNISTLKPHQPLKLSSTSVTFNLGEILNASLTGKMIIDYFKVNSRLNNNIRVLLVDSIISFVITKKIPMSINLADSIATYIVAMFPSEVKDTYFMKDGHNKNPKGKLYAKYYNSMRTLKTSGLVPSKERVKTAVEIHTQRRHDIEFEPEDDIHYMIDQIQNDANCSFPELEKLWKGTTKYRINSIQNSSSTTEIMNKWKNYALPLGYRLIDIDFNTLYPKCSNSVSQFEVKLEKTMLLMDEHVKDLNCRKIFESLKESHSTISENEKYTIIFYLMHAVFVPTSKKVTRDSDGKKNQVKYSIKDSQNSFIVFKNTVSEIEDHIKILKNEKRPVQPFIFIIGTLTKPKEILVFFDSIKYKLFSIISAIDICFKIFHLFNLEYPPEAYIVWLFIQKYFYSLNTKFDKSHHMLGQILLDLSI